MTNIQLALCIEHKQNIPFMKHTTKNSQTLATKGLQPNYSYIVQLGQPHQIAICDTLRKCSDAVSKHISDNDLGATEWYAKDENVGCIMHPLLGITSKVSYNGRVWDMTGPTTMPEITTGLDDLLTIDINAIINS